MNNSQPKTVAELIENRKANLRQSVRQDFVNYMNSRRVEDIVEKAVDNLWEEDVDTAFERHTDAEWDAVTVLVEEFMADLKKVLI